MTDSHGLTLRVYPTGAKTWVLRLCTLGRVTDIKLGNFPEMGLKEVRQITSACRVRFFGSRTVVTVDLEGVDRRKRSTDCHSTPTSEAIGVDVEFTSNVRYG